MRRKDILNPPGRIRRWQGQGSDTARDGTIMVPSQAMAAPAPAHLSTLSVPLRNERSYDGGITQGRVTLRGAGSSGRVQRHKPPSPARAYSPKGLRSHDSATGKRRRWHGAGCYSGDFTASISGFRTTCVTKWSRNELKNGPYIGLYSGPSTGPFCSTIARSPVLRRYLLMM